MEISLKIYGIFKPLQMVTAFINYFKCY